MPSPESGIRRNAYFAAWTAVWVVAIIGGLVAAYLASGPSDPTTLGQVWMIADSEDKEKLQAFLREQIGGIHDTVPDGDIGRILQRNVTKPFGGVSVTSNNAGMRDDRPYGPKAPGTYRVIVLGDSFAFGHEGLEEDRVGEQLQVMLRQHATIEGAEVIEVLTVAQGSWTAVNETAYMISHYSDYDPDLVIVLLVSNDLDDGQGVRGFGAATSQFSPQSRDNGSSFFSVYNSGHFGLNLHNLLYADLGPESTRRWQDAFEGLTRLEATIEATGAKLLVSAFDEYHSIHTRYPMSLWRDLIVRHADRSGLNAPLLFVNPYLEDDTLVGVHPNRRGHELLAIHYAHALLKLGWISVAAQAPLPLQHPSMDMKVTHDVDPERISAAQQAWLDAYLEPEIDFTDVDERVATSIYGGVFMKGPRLVASRKLTFLLERDRGQMAIEFDVEVPDFPELFPFALDLSVDGIHAGRLDLSSHDASGVHTLRAQLPSSIEPDGPIEIELFTRSHWSEIENAAMHSYYPLAARLID